MTIFGYRSFASGFLFSFAGFVLLSIAVAATRAYHTRRKLRRTILRTRPDLERQLTLPLDGTLGIRLRQFGLRALEAGQLGGVVQSDRIPHQSSTMRDQHIRRRSMSSRRSDSYSPTRSRRSSTLWHRPMPEAQYYHRDVWGNNEQQYLSLEDARRNDVLNPQRTNPQHQSQSLSSRQRVSLYAPRAVPPADPNKPFPPLPRPPKRARFSLPVPRPKIGRDHTIESMRRRGVSSQPSSDRSGGFHTSPFKIKLVPNRWKPLPSAPITRLFDGAGDSSSPVASYSAKASPPQKRHARARSSIELPALSKHPIYELSRPTTHDDLYDDYFDSYFQGYIVPYRTSAPAIAQDLDASAFDTTYVRDDRARKSLPITMSS